MYRMVLFSFFFFVSAIGFSKATDSNISGISNSDKELLNEVSKNYQKAKLVVLNVKKTVVAELLNKESSIEGIMTTGQGLFRWESEQPDKNLIIYDGTYLWNIQYPSADFGGEIQATKSEINKNNRSQILPALILSNEPIEKHFSIESKSSTKNAITFQLKSKSKDFFVQNLTLKINSDSKLIEEIYFKDEGGSTTFHFLKTEMQNQFSKKPFTYRPGPKVKVNII